jgi:hypothetical protein
VYEIRLALAGREAAIALHGAQQFLDAAADVRAQQRLGGTHAGALDRVGLVRAGGDRGEVQQRPHGQYARIGLQHGWQRAQQRLDLLRMARQRERPGEVERHFGIVRITVPERAQQRNRARVVTATESVPRRLKRRVRGRLQVRGKEGAHRRQRLGSDELVDDPPFAEQLDRGDAADLETRREFGLLVGVDLDDLEPVGVLRRDPVEDGAEHPARTAPGRPEIDEHGLVL